MFLFLLVRVASTLLHLPLLLPLPRDFASPAALDRIQGTSASSEPERKPSESCTSGLSCLWKADSLRVVGSAVAVYRQSLSSSLPLPRVLHRFCIAALGSSELSGPAHLFPLLRGSVGLDSTLSPHLARRETRVSCRVSKSQGRRLCCMSRATVKRMVILSVRPSFRSS